jgi:hypothetical protein
MLDRTVPTEKETYSTFTSSLASSYFATGGFGRLELACAGSLEDWDMF